MLYRCILCSGTYCIPLCENKKKEFKKRLKTCSGISCCFMFSITLCGKQSKRHFRRNNEAVVFINGLCSIGHPPETTEGEQAQQQQQD